MRIRRILAELRPFVLWAMAGGLLSSVAWNVHLMGRLEGQVAADTETATPVAVPDLGLTAEQRDRIRCCGMT